MLKKVSIFFLLLLLLFALSGCDQFYFKDYEASGKVEDSSGTGIEGATINFSDGSSVKSLSDGSWKQTGLKGDIEITPKKSDYTFTPTAHQLSQLDENKNNIIFKAESNGTDSSDSNDSDGSDDSEDSNNSDGSDDNNDEVEKTFTASGTITSNLGEAIPEVELTFDDGSSSVKTGTTGEWEKTGLTGDVTVTPKIEGWQFEIANKTLNADEKIADFTASPKKDYSHYSLSGEIYNNDSLNLTIIIEKEDGTIINRTVTDAGGNWQVNHVWGKVNIKPQIKGAVIGYEPEIQTASMEDDNIKFTAIIEDQTYTATGSVTDSNGDPVSGVVLSFSDGSGTVKTGPNGNWNKTGLVGDITVTPEKENWEFAPANKTVDETNTVADFEANLKSYIVSGEVTDESGNGIEGINIRFNDGEFSSVTTETDGSWTSGELTGEVEVKPMKTGYTFDPESIPVSTDDSNVDFRATAEEKPYTATGSVTNNGDPVPEVVLNFSDGSSVKTGSDGHWEQPGLVGEIIVTPELDDWQFSPANITLDEVNNIADFTAQPADNHEYYTLSGVVEDNYGVNIHIEIRRADDNTLIADVITDDDGTWISTRVWGSVVVTPQTTGSITEFTPPYQRFSGEETEVNFRADY